MCQTYFNQILKMLWNFDSKIIILNVLIYYTVYAEQY